MDALLLDYNGVIVRDEPLHFVSFRDTLAGEGIVISEPDYYAFYMGLDDRASFREAFRRHGRQVLPDAAEALVRAKSRDYMARAERDLALVPGVTAFVREAARQARIAVVSGALGSEIPLGLRRAGIEDLVDVLLTSDDVTTTKPDPAGYLLALRRLAARHGAGKWRAVVIEDSLPGIDAARAAGAGCVALATSHPVSALARADVVWGSFERHDPIELEVLWRRVDVA